MRTLTGHEPKSTCTVSNPETFTRELNTFYTRFDNHDFSTKCQNWLRALPLPDPAEPAPFTEEELRRQLSCCKPGKAQRPDGIPARVLKTCNQELSPVLHSLFQESLWTTTIPTLWKTSTIIPKPKRPRPTELNHYRPVALTSLIMKCFERILLNIILPLVAHHLDPSPNLTTRPKEARRMPRRACYTFSTWIHPATSFILFISVPLSTPS